MALKAQSYRIKRMLTAKADLNHQDIANSFISYHEGFILLIYRPRNELTYFRTLGRSGIPNPQVVLPLNDRVFSALQGTDADGHLRWVRVTAKGKDSSSESLFLASQKSRLPTDFLTKAKEVITPGTTIIFTDKPVDPTTQSHTGFQVVVAQKDKPSGATD
jgi:hypothetical protein